MSLWDKLKNFIIPEAWTPCGHCSAWDFDSSGHKVCRKSEEYWNKILEKQAKQKLLENESKKIGED